jgi:hypothetical protein
VQEQQQRILAEQQAQLLQFQVNFFFNARKFFLKNWLRVYAFSFIYIRILYIFFFLTAAIKTAASTTGVNVCVVM